MATGYGGPNTNGSLTMETGNLLSSIKKKKSFSEQKNKELITLCGSLFKFNEPNNIKFYAIMQIYVNM